MNKLKMSDELQREYALRFSRNQDYRMKVWRVLIDDFFQDLVASSAAVLDLGCGWGEFINQVAAGKKFGMDLNPESAQRLSPKVQFFQQDCSLEWPLEAASLDVVFTSNFFEHLPSKSVLNDTLAQVYRCLKPGGSLIAMGPNIRYLPGTYWDFWDHYLPLTDRSLSEGLELRGFTIDRSLPRFLPYTMATGCQFPLLALKLYLRCRAAWPVFGRQFLIIAKRGRAENSGE